MTSLNAKVKPPDRFEDYLMKRKKWPRKGWHKRYFVLENGLLKYAKTPRDIQKDKLHGKMDVGLSVMSSKKNALRFDLDAEHTIFHLKAKSPLLCQRWIAHIRAHKQFRNPQDVRKDSCLTNVSLGILSPVLPVRNDESFKHQKDISNACNNHLSELQREIDALGWLLDELNAATAAFTFLSPASPSLRSKKERKQSKKLAKKSHKHSASSASDAGYRRMSTSVHSSSTPVSELHRNHSLLEAPSRSRDSKQNMSHSNPDLTILTAADPPTITRRSPGNLSDDPEPPFMRGARSTNCVPNNNHRPTTPSSLPSPGEIDATDTHLRFLNSATTVRRRLAELAADLARREDALMKSGDARALKATAAQLTHENRQLRARLDRIHHESALDDDVTLVAAPASAPRHSLDRQSRLISTTKPMISQMSTDSQLSINETVSELFFDAEEYLLSDDESTTDGEESDGLSTDGGSEPDDSETLSYTHSMNDSSNDGGGGGGEPATGGTGRREQLPCPRPDSDVSLWNILKKNIGKDLSKVAMPVTLNEPLNTLQLLCEELEYSELLEKAANCDDKFDRMVLVAAFSVSAYGSTYHRAGQKPFNPILGETYECIREDRRFRFVAEQVSHHPPVSVCHCDGENFEFWQDSRFKNKFWGKSMEIFPIGSVHVRLKRYDATYHWRKVTSCVHNIISGTRWIEHYGDMIITSDDVTCKLTFSKSGYWNNKNGEVTGVVTDGSGDEVRQLHGRWFEAMFCGVGSKARCIWRSGAMPPDLDKYYGFTRFAMELNEIEPQHRHLLPRTDTRFRPDQRLLEEGDVARAEAEKQRVEQLQREQKKLRDSNRELYQPMFFCKLDDDVWEFKGDYWKLRRDPGFAALDKLPLLW